MPSKFFFKPSVTIPVAPIITGTVIQFMFHIRCICIHKLSYFSVFSASFCVTFLSFGIAAYYYYYYYYVINSLLRLKYKSYVCLSTQHLLPSFTPLPCL
jgi:hypothetical protein